MKEINSLYIVDDDPIVVFGIKKMLKAVVLCEDVEAFPNALHALEDIKERLSRKQTIPKIIFLDINMPVMDGWDFLEEVAKLDIKEKMIINIITSSIDPVDHQKWMTLKPTFPHHLNFKNKPICSIEIDDLEIIDLAS